MTATTDPNTAEKLRDAVRYATYFKQGFAHGVGNVERLGTDVFAGVTEWGCYDEGYLFGQQLRGDA